MDGLKSKRTEADGFPDDPLAEILSRLPAKPLFWFKCVSEGWCHLITDRLGRRKFPQTLEGFFVGGGGGMKDWRFINLSGKSAPLVDASFSFLTKLPGIKQINLLSAHNGLLLFEHLIGCGRYEYIVCNPATEQWMFVPGPVLLPDPPRMFLPFKVNNSFLIFDPAVSLHFHLVQFSYWDIGISVHVFSSETGVWRYSTREWWTVLAFGEVPSKFGCADVNGMIYVPVYLPLTQTQQIAVVDAQGKISTAICWPDMKGFHAADFISTAIHWPDLKEFHDAAFTGQSQGHLHCITAHKKQEGHLVHVTGLSIWVLEDYDGRLWILKQSVVVLSCLEK